MSSNTYDNANVVDLADKHHVSLTYFQGKPYFHIRNNYNNKSVSLGYSDLKSLVDQFDDMKDRMKRLKRSIASASTSNSATQSQPSRKKAKKEEEEEEDVDRNSDL